MDVSSSDEGEVSYYNELYGYANTCTCISILHVQCVHTSASPSNNPYIYYTQDDYEAILDCIKEALDLEGNCAIF